MTRFSYVKFAFLVAASFICQNCSDTCTVSNTYIYYEPVYSTSAELKAAVSFDDPKPLTSLGKIYFKDGYLYINESGEGIHVIDNRNPAAPLPLGFITIPGNYDLAMVNDLLYADSFVDLVVLDVSNKQNIKEVNRVERVFNHALSYGYRMVTNENLILTDWEEVRSVTVQESECSGNQLQNWGGMWMEDGIALRSFSGLGASVIPTSTTGIGGSMARFTIAENHLYALDGAMLDVIDVSTPGQPQPKAEQEISWDIETLFPYNGILFGGSRSGMYIYDLVNPAAPQLLSKYEHVRSCDPVVVQDNYAFVTLRNGSECEGFVNQLEVIDITSLTNPKLVKIYPMTNPHGLGIDNSVLFICDGSDGLKAYDASDVNAITTNQLAHHKDIQALDIIPHQSIAMMIGPEGLYQYNYSDLTNIRLISTLAIVR
jgi:hypothetical protein